MRGTSQRIENQILFGLILKQNKLDFLVGVFVHLVVLFHYFAIGQMTTTWASII